MCTVTYLRRADEFFLTMNRDERLDRGREIPPRRFRLNDQKPECAWPIDSDAGGTWIGANNYGIAACILNGYERSDAQKRGFRSRGTIIPLALQLASLDEIERWLAHDFEAIAFKSFSLLVVQRENMMFLYSDGMGTITFDRPDGVPQIWSSSSWKADEVLPWREQEFIAWYSRGLQMNSANVPTFHLMQPEGRAEWAPMMRRDKSATRSISQVVISPGDVTLKYWKCPLKDDFSADRVIVLNASSLQN
ncbi:MAG: NRDE family protein [Candidatus Sumerlaeota bacterium]